MHNFKELKVWQKAKNLVKDIYILTKKFPSDERYCLISQMQRACISIPSNIAEGSGRGTDKDFTRFLEIALSSSFELETQLILANELNYFSEEELKNNLQNLAEIQRMLIGFINKIEK